MHDPGKSRTLSERHADQTLNAQNQRKSEAVHSEALEQRGFLHTLLGLE